VARSAGVVLISYKKLFSVWTWTAPLRLRARIRKLRIFSWSRSHPSST